MRTIDRIVEEIGGKAMATDGALKAAAREAAKRVVIPDLSSEVGAEAWSGFRGVLKGCIQHEMELLIAAERGRQHRASANACREVLQAEAVRQCQKLHATEGIAHALAQNGWRLIGACARECQRIADAAPPSPEED